MRYAALSVIFFFIAKFINGGFIFFYMITVFLPVTIAAACLHVFSHIRVNYDDKDSSRALKNLAISSNVLIVFSAFILPDFSGAGISSLLLLIGIGGRLKTLELLSYGALISALVIDIIIIFFPFLKKALRHVVEETTSTLKRFLVRFSNYRTNWVNWLFRAVLSVVLIGAILVLLYGASQYENTTRQAVVVKMSPLFISRPAKLGHRVVWFSVLHKSDVRSLISLDISEDIKLPEGTKVLIQVKRYPFGDRTHELIKVID